MDIALNTYSLRNEWGLYMMDNYAPLLRVIDELGVQQVELLDRHYENNADRLTAIQQVLADHGVTIFSIGPHTNLLTNPENSDNQVAAGKAEVDMAADHDIPKFRVSIGGGKYDPPGTEPASVDQAVEWAAKVFGPVVDYASDRGVTLCIETHHRYSSNPAWQAGLLEAVPSEHLGFIFDIGNFETEDLRWGSLDLLCEKRAVKYMHAKAYAFDDQGFETTLDYPRAVQQLHAAGLEVPLSIEWEGKLVGPLGALKTNELCKYSIAKAEGRDYAMKVDFPAEEPLMDSLLG